MKFETILLLLGAAGLGYFLYARGQGQVGTLPGNVATLPPLPAVPFPFIAPPLVVRAATPAPDVPIAASTPPPPKTGDACQVQYNVAPGTSRALALDGTYNAAGVCTKVPGPFDWMN